MNNGSLKIKLLTITALIIFLLGAGFCFAQGEPENLSNLRILYQGQLTDSEGNPLEDGRYNIRFVIYDEETQGNILWQEEYAFYNGISVENGKFKVILGREKPIILNLDEAPFWLGITIGTATEEGEIQWGEEIQLRKKITTLSEFLGVEELTPEQWENLSQLIKEKLGDETDIVLLFDLAQMESLNTEETTNLPSNIISFFQNFINFISEKISEIGEKLSTILAKLEGIISTLADIKNKIDVLYNVLVVKPGLAPAEIESQPPSAPPGMNFPVQETGRLILQQGEDSVKVLSPLVKEESLMFVSFLDEPESVWWISGKIPGESFTISLKEPASRDLRFDYWILDKEVSVCTPDWSCTEWQLLPENVVCGESFTQIRTCTDSNSCGIEEGKPIESQDATGNQCSTGTCQTDGTCSSE